MYISRHQLANVPPEEQLYAICTTDATEERATKPATRMPLEERIVKEFADVFPATLPSQLPPPRNIDHAIELVPGAEPPSHLTYKLLYVKMDELKKN